MAQPPEEIARQLRGLIQPGARDRLVARGLARGMIWKEGQLPTGARPFARSLTSDLLDHGYLILSRALRLRETGTHADLAEDAFRVAAESIEAAVRRGDPAMEGRGFHLVVAATAFHLAHLAARSYCLVPEDTRSLNLSSPEQVLTKLMRRNLHGLREVLRAWMEDERNTDEGVAARLAMGSAGTGNGRSAPEDEAEPDFSAVDAVVVAVTRRIIQGLARFEYALRAGSPEQHAAAVEALRSAAEVAGEVRLVTLWWVATLARHLIDELWGYSLHERIPRARGPEDGDFDALRIRFIRVLACRPTAEVDLWPSQIDAARRAIDPGDDLVVALPTSAGKTRIAELCILRTLAVGQRVVYVTPLRALSAQLERNLSRSFRPLGFSVSSLYGASGVSAEDVRTLRSASIVVSTPEKLDFSMRQDPGVLDDIGLVVLDEGHMIGESTREIRYEVLVQRLLSRPDADRRRIVCLSAVFGQGHSFDDFVRWLRSDEAGEPVRSAWRPTRQRSGVLRWMDASGRLDLEVDDEKPYVPQFVRSAEPLGLRKKPFPKDAGELTVAAALALVDDGHRVLVYCPQRKSVESLGEDCLTLHRQGYLRPLLRREGAIRRAERLAAEWLGEDHVAARALRLGIGIHHGGLPRPFLAEIEHLLNDKVLPIVVASPTVAQGLDLSCSALVFHSIYRGGEVIEPKEYANVVGRAGRAFVDLDGLTVYPVFEKTKSKGDQRVRDYQKLRRQSESRHLESGILLLIRRIVSVLAWRLGDGYRGLIEYVLNHGGDWEAATPAPLPAGVPVEEDDSADLGHLLADLDTMLYSTVENLDCPTEDLADLLDAALRSSLWRRRLEHLHPMEREVQWAVLKGRARWLWTRSGSAARKACYASGLGYAAGQFIDRNLDALISDLDRAEGCLSSGDIDGAIEVLTRLAGVLLDLHPFETKKPAGWEKLLSGWIRGTPVGRLVDSTGGGEVIFIQDAFVYRLVWAVEAVRIHAQIHGDFRAVFLTGIAPLALTYGLPTQQACLLAQAGLPSRTMILHLLARYPATFATAEELSFWVGEVAAKIPADFWPDETTAELWRTFINTSPTVNTGRWVESRTDRRVLWEKGAASLEPGSSVQLIHDAAAAQTVIYGPDLSRMGILAEPMPNLRDGYAEAVIQAPDSINVRFFGPKNAVTNAA
jgi:hypothetical protein